MFPIVSVYDQSNMLNYSLYNFPIFVLGISQIESSTERRYPLKNWYLKDFLIYLAKTSVPALAAQSGV